MIFLLGIGYNPARVAATAQDVLVAIVADLLAGAPVFFRVSVEHIGRVLEAVTGLILAEPLAMTLVALLAFGLGGRAVLYRVAKV
jgi:hypothetical protein